MYLLDTNALLFFLYDSEKLTEKASRVIYRSNEIISVSIVSMWEIEIKSSIGKLKIRTSISKIVETCGKEQLEILRSLEETAWRKYEPNKILRHRPEPVLQAVSRPGKDNRRSLGA